MKKLFMLFLLIGLLSSSVSTQSTSAVYLKNGSIVKGEITLVNDSVTVETSDGSVFIYSLSEVKKITKVEATPIKKSKKPRQVEAAPAQEVVPVVMKPKNGFGLRGGIFANIESWTKLALKSDENRIGIGAMGIITAGYDFDDMYIGAGPGFSINYWWVTKQLTAGGHSYTTTASITTSDIDLNFAFGIDDMYVVVGTGSSAVSIGATVNGEGDSVELPESAPFMRYMIGWASQLVSVYHL